MKPNDQEDLEEVVKLLKNDKATRRDMKVLLITLRDHLPRTVYPMLLDIAHSVAHSGRDRGLAYDYIEEFVGRFIDFARDGANLEVKVLFPIEEVIEELSHALSQQGIMGASKEILLQHEDRIEELLEGVMDDIQVKLTNPNVSSCTFKVIDTDQGKEFVFSVNFVGLENLPIIQLYENVALCFPVFRD